MGAFSRKVTVNGWTNLGTALRAAGYAGGGIISSLGIFNPSSTVVYLHLSNSGVDNPADAVSADPEDDGWPIGDDAAAVSKEFYSDRGANTGSLDIGTTWLYSGSSVDIRVLVTGV